jgi:hypothetical protein
VKFLAEEIQKKKTYARGERRAGGYSFADINWKYNVLCFGKIIALRQNLVDHPNLSRIFIFG